MTSPQATVFYDGQCPLCRREIAHYRRLRGAETLRWIDITREDEALAAHGLSRETAMARFHVLDAAGRWQSGARGFVELWSHLPAYRWLARLLRALRLIPALDGAYTLFARWRLRRQCNGPSCSVPGEPTQRAPATAAPRPAERHSSAGGAARPSGTGG